jgi:predicted aminopeptidase
VLVVVLAALACGGCALTVDLPYYWQSARGQLELIRLARPVDALIAAPDTDPALRARLQLARDIRRFASDQLGLPDNGSYTRYAGLGRPFVVWNVFAAPELSLALKTWCFPVAGCVAYRGYFAREAAEALAADLRAQGWETQVAGVPAYSTLGWFDDPLLDTFVNLPETELARLIFHELAHQVVYLPGDSSFNESFATAVEEEGLARWLAHRGDPALRERHQETDRRRRDFLALLHDTRQRLEAAYGAPVDDAQRRRDKQAIFDDLRARYRTLRASWGGFAGYDRWFAQPLGNAHLASVATYTTWVPGFRRMLEAQAGDLPRFYEAVRELAGKSAAERAGTLGNAGSL